MSSILNADHTHPLEGGASYSFTHRLVRLTWNIVWLLAASWTPPILHPWRRVLLRLFGAKISPTANIYGSAKVWFPGNLVVEEHACIGPRSTVYSMALITLKPYALVSQGAHLCAGTHDIEDPYFQLYARPISVGSRAWIAAEAFVGPGVTVGEGAVLGARAVTFRDLDTWTIYAGNPAKALKSRNIRPAA